MKLDHWYPCYPYNRTQSFGGNSVSFYKDNGLVGHTSEDLAGEYGQEIRAGISGFVYSVLNKNNPDPNKYRAVYILEEGDNGYTDCMEVSFGHLKDILVNTGDYVTPETVIGTMGNFGDVFFAGQPVTREEKLAGSKLGTHLHGPQCRPVKRTKDLNNGVKYLADANGIYKKDGYYFEIPLYNNGYNGCVDPAKYWNKFYARDFAVTMDNIEKQFSLVKEVLRLFKDVLKWKK